MSIDVRLLFLSLAVCLACSASPSWGAGSGAGGGRGGADASDLDYQAGMVAAKVKDWKQVVARMTAVTQRNPRNADAWNELGHAYRQLGEMDSSFKNYARALQIDPRHKGAHEYMGEAYLQVGQLELAEQELKALDGICFVTCEEYRELKEEIARYKRERMKASTLI